MSQRARATSRSPARRFFAHLCSSFAAMMLSLALLGSTAHAETAIPAQAAADGGAFLPSAPPPPQLGGLCLVDTGVNVNPDTEGVVVERTAIDGGSGNGLSPTDNGD